MGGVGGGGWGAAAYALWHFWGFLVGLLMLVIAIVSCDASDSPEMSIQPFATVSAGKRHPYGVRTDGCNLSLISDNLQLTLLCRQVKLTMLKEGSVNVMKTLGERIRELREERDLSLRELGSKIQVSAAFLSDVELGRRYLSDKNMLAVARALGVSLEELKQSDTRPPLREFRRATMTDPTYGFAFRQMMDRKISSREILDFIKQRDERLKRGKRERG